MSVLVSAGLLGTLTTACVLGVTHAIEPDHVAGISSLTSGQGDPKLSAVVGACFSMGHVVLVVAWLTVGYVLLGQTSFPASFDAFGKLAVAVVLGAVGLAMAFTGLRTALTTHTHEHEHDGETHTHRHRHLLPFAGESHDHDHADGLISARTVAGYLKTGVVGGLFALSPPISMIAFAATLFPNYGAGVVALAVVAYAVAITLAMSLIGAGAGAMFGATKVDPRVHGAARGVAGVLVTGFALVMLAGVLPTLG